MTRKEQATTLEGGGVEVGEGTTASSLGTAFAGERWENWESLGWLPTAVSCVGWFGLSPSLTSKAKPLVIQEDFQYAKPPFSFPFFEESLYCFPPWLHQFIVPSTAHKGSLVNPCYPFEIAIPAGVRWYLRMVLIYTSLMISEVEHFLCAWWLSVRLLQKSVYLSLLSIFESFNIKLYELFIYFIY